MFYNDSTMADYYENFAKVLFHSKRFVKEIKKARKSLSIPEDGFTSDEDAQTWVRRFPVDVDFHYGSTKDLVPSMNYQNVIPDKKVLKIVNEIIENFNLDTKWQFGIFEFILSSSRGLAYPQQSLEIKVELKSKSSDVFETKEGLVTGITIKLTRDTSIKDIEAHWNKVEEYQKLMDPSSPQRKKVITDQAVEKFIKIRDLEDSGLTQQEIADSHRELGFRTATDVATFKRDIQKPFSSRKKKK